MVLTKSRNVATVAAAFFAISLPVVFSTDLLKGSSKLGAGIVVILAVLALGCLAYAIWRVFQQQKPHDQHKALPREAIGKDLVDILYSEPRSPEEQAERERQAIRELAQHYAGLADAKGERTRKIANDYDEIVKFCAFAVVLVAVEFTVALIVQV